jgi:DNA-damage-inducible protein J
VSKSANLNIRTDPDIKMKAERLYKSFGITLTDAVNIFLRQSIMVGGLPFEMKQPRYNAETEAAIKEARDIAAGAAETKQYAALGDFMADVRQEMEREDADL